VYTAEVRVCDVSEFPVREFNPEWEKAVAAQPPSKSEEEFSETQKLIAIYTSRTTSIVS
jgi:hypothetical protein